MNVYVFLKKGDSKEFKTNLEFRKVKCVASRSNNWAKLIKYESCISSQ